MQRFKLSIVPTLVAALFAAGLALGAEEKKPDATVKIHEGSVAAGIGWSWGGGQLMYAGKTHKFKIQGLTVAEVGVTKAEATGSVYNLKNLDDINGVYAAAGTEGTMGKGAGVSSLRNDKGVVINLKSETKGANIKIAAEGLKITLEK